jgi:hypothetical protein
VGLDSFVSSQYQLEGEACAVSPLWLLDISVGLICALNHTLGALRLSVPNPDWFVSHVPGHLCGGGVQVGQLFQSATVRCALWASQPLS